LTSSLIFAKVDHSEVLWIPVVWIKSIIRRFHSVSFVSELLLHHIPLQDFRNKFPEASSELVSIGGLQFQADRLGSPFQIVGEMKPSAIISTETVRNPETTTRPQVTDPTRRVVKLLHTRVETIWNFSKLARGLAKLQRFWCR
jgi:hypothetical protein